MACERAINSGFDQDLDQVILCGLLLRVPKLDDFTAYQAGLGDAPDLYLLAWPTEQKRVLVTDDRRTMQYDAAARIASGQNVAGVIIISRRLPVSQVINDLEIIVSCSDLDEWENVLKYLPL